MKKANEAIIAGVIILYANGEPATGKVVTAKVYDEAYALFSEPAVSEITGTGVYYTTFTPDAEGLWTIIFDCADPNVTRAYSWYVQEQVADDIDTLLSRVSVNVATETKQDIIDGIVDSILVDTAAMQPKIPRIVCHMDFWSLPLQVTITSTAGDRGLVDVVVSGLPAGVTIIAVQGMFLCDSVENSYDGVNYLESTKIQVKIKTDGTDRDAITLEANKIFRFTAQMVRGGTVLIADWATATDAGILAEVATNTTYQMWFDVGEAVQNNIVLDGAQFGLRIWYSV